MFEKEIEEYEDIRQMYQEKVADRIDRKQWMEYNEILFSAHSCAIEGNSFTVDDTRILREQGMAVTNTCIPSATATAGQAGCSLISSSSRPAIRYSSSVWKTVRPISLP